MTLTQVIRRIRTIALEHQQIRSFHRGYAGNVLNEPKTRYPAVILQDTGGLIGLTSRKADFAFRMLLVDLVHVASETDANELDAQSDMVSIALDLLAQFNRGELNNWRISGSNALRLVFHGDATKETGGDMFAGVEVDFTISIMYDQNVCQVPSDLTNYNSL